MDRQHRATIANEFESCITNTISRLENGETSRPFHSALLSEDALFWSRFERSFSTSFGQRVIERISRIAALAGGAQDATTQKETIVNLSDDQIAAIDSHISQIRGGGLGRTPNWELDLASVASAATSGYHSPVRVISDLWWRKNEIEHFMSIKTVKPNIDQTAEAKRDLLKLALHNDSFKVYFGLYYNPYGDQREDYGWTPPMGVFDFRHDPVVLIGRDYWDTLGGTGFYHELLSIAEEVGQRTRSRLESMRRK